MELVYLLVGRSVCKGEREKEPTCSWNLYISSKVALSAREKTSRKPSPEVNPVCLLLLISYLRKKIRCEESTEKVYTFSVEERFVLGAYRGFSPKRCENGASPWPFGGIRIIFPFVPTLVSPWSHVIWPIRNRIDWLPDIQSNASLSRTLCKMTSPQPDSFFLISCILDRNRIVWLLNILSNPSLYLISCILTGPEPDSLFTGYPSNPSLSLITFVLTGLQVDSSVTGYPVQP